MSEKSEKFNIDSELQWNKHEILRTKIDQNHDLVILSGEPTKDIKNATGSYRIVFKNKSGDETLDLGSLDGSPNTKFIDTGDEDQAGEYNGREVLFPISFLTDPRQILAVLHEMGHNHERDLRQARQDNKIKHKVDYEKHNYSGAVYGKIRQLESEREAWAWALKTARRIKKDFVINLFDSFSDTEELSGWLRHIELRSYEEDLQKIMDEGKENVLTKDKQVNAWKENQQKNFTESDMQDK